ncbi:MAG: hypothetical protein EXS35_11255 [Pedosphaera sp.]|nr:hypothetical protein [Pedosphaera sp.]
MRKVFVNFDDPFSPAKRAEMRAEILRDGLLADKFLANDPDVPAFGLNLACAWPFPEVWRASYERMAHRLSALGPWIYVYPFPFTHVTLVTFASFARHTRPTAEIVKALKEKLPAITDALAPLFTEGSPERIKPFTLRPQSPVLARGAGILPLLNPDDEVARLRQRTVELLQRNETLHRELTERGLNVPGIIHSTVMRFRQPPPDLEKFLATFDEIAAETKFPPMEVGEILLTSETKPYMRSGEVLRRLTLTSGSP